MQSREGRLAAELHEIPMPDVVFSPPTPYKEENYTKATQFNLLSFVSQYGQRKAIQVANFGPSQTDMYTVPLGKVFFLIAYTISGVDSTAFDGYARITFNKLTGTIGAITLRNNIGQSIAGSINPPMRFLATETITAVTSPNATTNAVMVITGYEIDASLLPNLV